MARDFSFYIDRGGTFTDVVACVPDAAAPGGSRFRVLKARLPHLAGRALASSAVSLLSASLSFAKPPRHASLATPVLSSRAPVSQLLSVDPGNYADAPTEGIRRVLEQGTRRSCLRASRSS